MATQPLNFTLATIYNNNNHNNHNNHNNNKNNNNNNNHCWTRFLYPFSLINFVFHTPRSTDIIPGPESCAISVKELRNVIRQLNGYILTHPAMSRAKWENQLQVTSVSIFRL
jgi:hypothetical protein